MFGSGRRGWRGGEWMRGLVWALPILWEQGSVGRVLCLFDVVGHGLGSTSPSFVKSRAIHPAGLHGWLAKKTVNRAPIAVGGKVRYNVHNNL